MKATGELTSGSVGYIITGLKTIKDSRVGDTITHVGRPCDEPLQGFRPAQSMVFAGIYPISTDDYGALRESLENYSLMMLRLTLFLKHPLHLDLVSDVDS